MDKPRANERMDTNDDGKIFFKTKINLILNILRLIGRSLKTLKRIK